MTASLPDSRYRFVVEARRSTKIKGWRDSGQLSYAVFDRSTGRDIEENLSREQARETVRHLNARQPSGGTTDTNTEDAR